MKKQKLLLLLVIITAFTTTLFLPGLVRSDEIFIDNLDAEASCYPESTFSTSSWCSQRYLSNYHYHTANGGSDTFTWDIAARGGYAAGKYEIFAYWCADPSRAPDATYTVYHDLDGVPSSTVIMQNQQVNGGEWVSLGRFDFDGNDDEKVELVQSANGIVMADAIKFAPVPEKLLIDNVDVEASCTANWGISSWAPGFYGDNYHYHAANGGSDTFTWRPTILEAGPYEVFARWTAGPSRAMDAHYTIYCDQGIGTVIRNQQLCGGQWNSLGVYMFDGLDDDRVELLENPGGIVVADALYIERYRRAPVERTGQTTLYSTRDDGDLQCGIHWPVPRFTDNGDGTVTDNLTRLVWLKDANCAGTKLWLDAVDFAAALQNGDCGLSDGSAPGDWRLPNVKELLSLIHYGYHYPAVPDTDGNGQWSHGDAFTNVQNEFYWSSTTSAESDLKAWILHMGDAIGHDFGKDNTAEPVYVWPVRGGNCN